MTPDQIVATTLARVTALADADAGDPAIRFLLDRAHQIAPLLLRDLDPRIPPAALGQGLIVISSDAAALVAEIYGPVESLPVELKLLLNVLATVAVACIELDEAATTSPGGAR